MHQETVAWTGDLFLKVSSPALAGKQSFYYFFPGHPGDPDRRERNARIGALRRGYHRAGECGQAGGSSFTRERAGFDAGSGACLEVAS